MHKILLGLAIFLLTTNAQAGYNTPVPPAGTNGQLQYNNNGTMGGLPQSTFDAAGAAAAAQAASDPSGAAATVKSYFTALTGILSCNGSGCTASSTVPTAKGGLDTGSTQNNPQSVVRQYNGTSASFSAQNNYCLNCDPIYLPHWRAALARARTNGGNAVVDMLGDSTTFGTGATGTVAAQFAYPAVFANYLTNDLATYSTWDAVTGAGATINQAQFDSRVTVGSGWSNNGNIGLAGGQYTTTSNAGTLSYSFIDSNSNASVIDTFKVFYLITTSSGVLSANIDGGAAQTFATSGAANGLGSFTITATSPGKHTLNLNWSSGGAVFVQSVRAYDSTRSTVLVENMGIPGIQAAQLAVTNNGWGPAAVGAVAPFQVVCPDLAVIDLGINDADAGTSVASYTSAMQSLITSAKQCGTTDVALLTFDPINPSYSGAASIATQNAYIQAIYSLGASNNVPVIDNYSRWSSYTVSQPLGYYADTFVHPTARGHSDIGGFLAQSLVGGSSSYPAKLKNATTTANCSGAYSLTFPPAGGDTTYDLTPTAACSVSITAPTPISTGAAQRLTLIIRPSSFQTTLPASSAALVWNNGVAPTPVSGNYNLVTFFSDGTAPVFGGY